MSIYATAVSELYVTLLHRPADLAGLAHWSKYAEDTGGNLSMVAWYLKQSQEFQGMYAHLDNTSLVDHGYGQLFGHPPDASGKQFWINALNNNDVSRENFLEVLASAASGKDYRALELKKWAAENFTAMAAHIEPQATYGGAIETEAARIWLLQITDDNSYARETSYTNLWRSVGDIAFLEGDFAIMAHSSASTALEDSSLFNLGNQQDFRPDSATLSDEAVYSSTDEQTVAIEIIAVPPAAEQIF